jgi:hypothetical protein
MTRNHHFLHVYDYDPANAIFKGCLEDLDFVGQPQAGNL